MEATPHLVCFVHDPDARILENHSLPLLVNGYGLPKAGFEVRGFSNRNEFLAAIADEQRDSVALIDLQHNDRRDLNYSGHRIIETVRRHPYLWKTCRPYAFTVHANRAAAETTRDHGGYGLVARSALDAPASGPDLAGLLNIECARNTRHFDEDIEPFKILPRGSLQDPAIEEDSELASIQQIFSRKRGLNDKQWMVLRLYAENIQESAIDALILQRFGSGASKPIERLKRQLRPNYHKTGPDLRAAALDLFELLPSRRPAPAHETDWNTLPEIELCMELLADNPSLVELGYLDEDAIKRYRLVTAHLPARRFGGNLGQHLKLERINEAVETVVKELPSADRAAETRSYQRALVRTVWNVLDTDASLVT